MYEDFPDDADKEFSAVEIVKIATDLKSYGTKAFQGLKNLSLGFEKYQKGLRYLNEDPNLDAESEETKKALDALRYSLNSNSALVANKLGDFAEGVRCADAALQVSGLTDVEKGKALFRRAVANVGLKDEDAAVEDLEKAAVLVPEDGGVKQELAKLRKAAAERAKKEKAAYSKFFT